MYRDFRYKMFEINMDEYLDEEVDAVKQTFDTICKSWDKQVRCIHIHLYWIQTDYDGLGRRINRGHSDALPLITQPRTDETQRPRFVHLCASPARDYCPAYRGRRRRSTDDGRYSRRPGDRHA